MSRIKTISEQLLESVHKLKAVPISTVPVVELPKLSSELQNLMTNGAMYIDALEQDLRIKTKYIARLEKELYRDI